ncbi:hypothetical protein BO70DRAFT_363689 [Aspergillus heteromorphus CBS 117.55]|uniref:Uncharacterized protein n=1 Tax=Aspergillus heteromorphus CBS 117.55 TaxID=1448321 RepID=A0A317VVX2_9EURO|nr:uncharacterized protein BO70DRAFT_363689 [Aspergillus heteromorphus CBS 117.55]PWY77132.1 hypothetical protein BO70DRAFT_363689 [Aspergillus heteromorphus CBS 117.55]
MNTTYYRVRGETGGEDSVPAIFTTSSPNIDINDCSPSPNNAAPLPRTSSPSYGGIYVWARISPSKNPGKLIHIRASPGRSFTCSR